MEFSEKIDLISAAISKFQAEVSTAKKTSANPYFNSKYADLAEVWDTVKTPLCKNGLAVVQSPENNEGKVIITTLITHTSGQWIKGSLAMQPVKTDPQSYGSCITYGRRYSLGAFLGIATELDDDGNKASDLDTKESPATKAYEAKKAAGKPAPVNQGESKKEAKWTMGEITKILTPELKARFSERKATSGVIINFFETFDGDQGAILAAMNKEA